MWSWISDSTAWLSTEHSTERLNGQVFCDLLFHGIIRHCYSLMTASIVILFGSEVGRWHLLGESLWNQKGHEHVTRAGLWLGTYSCCSCSLPEENASGSWSLAKDFIFPIFFGINILFYELDYRCFQVKILGNNNVGKPIFITKLC